MHGGVVEQGKKTKKKTPTEELNSDVETTISNQSVFWLFESWYRNLASTLAFLLASLLLCVFQTLVTTENEWEDYTGDMVMEQVGQFMIGGKQWHEYDATCSSVPTGVL